MYLEQSMPICENGCGKQAIRYTKKGKAVCSERPAGCPSVQKRMQETCIDRYGVANASSNIVIKSKRETTLTKKYGVKNASHIASAKQKIAEATTRRWEEVTTSLLENSKVNQNLSKKEYYKMVGHFSEKTYKIYIDTLDPLRKRGDEWHLDHKVSIFEGYHNGIPPHVIGSLVNLEVIPGLENETKSLRCSQSVDELLLAYRTQFGDTVSVSPALEKPNHKNKTLYLQLTQKTCKYCSEIANYSTEDSSVWCCSPHRNKCPEIRRKNSLGQRRG